MSQGTLSLLRKRLCATDITRSLKVCKKSAAAKGDAGNFCGARNLSRGPRRKSLTLATTWGEPFFISKREGGVRCYYKAAASVAKGQEEATHLAKRNASQAAVLAGTRVSACPFHAFFESKAKPQSSIRSPLVATSVKPSLDAQAASASIAVSSAVKQLIGLFRNEKNAKTYNFRHLIFGSKVEEASSTSATRSYSCIPGPRGLPLLGSVLDYTFLGPFSPREFHKALRSRHSRYGKIFKERFLSEEFVYTSDPADVQILVHNEQAAPCRPHIDAIVESRKQEGYPVGITALQGEEWAKLRGALNSAVMKPKVVRSYAEAQKNVVDDFVEFMKSEKSPATGEIPDFEVWLNRWALESVAVILLDTRLGLIGPDGRKDTNPVADTLRKAMDVFFDYGARLTFSAPLWKLWQTKDWKIFCQSQKDEFQSAGYYVDKKLEEIKSAESCDAAKTEKASKAKAVSFLEHLLSHKELERDESVTLCLELLAGGIDTSSNAVTFTLFQLAKNKECQETLRDLIRKDAGDPFPGTNAESSRYLRACVMEALRLHPLTYVNMRKTNKDLVLSGYDVPAGTTVRYTPHLMHLRNEEYFPNADEYIPDRWVSRSSPFKCTKQFVFTPFGHGARQCPGRRIAEQEFDLLLRAILLNFRVEYHHEDIGVQVRLFNSADKPARFSFVPLQTG